MSENGYIKKEDVFNSLGVARRYADVYVQGFKFRIRSLNDREASHYDSMKVTRNGTLNRSVTETQNARIIALCCVNGDGELLFNQFDDVERLRDLDSSVITELAEHCLKHCRMDEEPEKNSLETTSGGSRIE